MYNVKFDKSAEVRGDALKLFITALPTGQESRSKILADHGIVPESGKWHNMENTVKAYHEIGGKVGSNTLFMLGKGVATSVPYPPNTDLRSALKGINYGYHINHALNGKPMYSPETGKMYSGIGSYDSISFNEEKKEAIMKCSNPYPSKLDEGIIMQVLRMFKPQGSISQQIRLDTTKEMRDSDGGSCTFILTW